MYTYSKMTFLQSLKLEQAQNILKEALKIIIDFYTFYYANQKEIPTPDELISVLMYELRLNKEQVYEILEILNYKGVILWDGKRWQINYKMLVTDDG